MENKEIKIQGTISLADEPAREMLKSLETRIETINERTKQHTLEIRELKKQIKD